MAKRKEVPEDIQRLLKAVVDSCDAEDRAVRERQIRTWRRLKLFWEGFQKVWYSEVAHDWRIWDETNDQNTDQEYYDKPANVFRAYLESIIAALSVTVPPVRCYPDDADNPLDLATAKAGDKISSLIYRHNNVPLLWLHSLFVYCTEGMVGCYSYPKEDAKFGLYEENQYENVIENHQITSCPLCGFQLDDQQVEQFEDLKKQELDEFQPDNEDAELHAELNNDNGQDICPNCMQMMDPDIRQDSFTVTRIVGVTSKPKSRICMESYGGLNIKIPNYARTQEECPYLTYSYEIHYSLALEKFEHLMNNRDLAKKIASGNNPGSYSLYEQWGRLSPQYQGEYPINVVTEQHTWLRPAQFNILADEKDINKLKKHFPDGAHVILVNDVFADARNEALDDCWTLTINPLSNFLHHDPLGMLLTSIQEITNDLNSLILQTIEHGVPLTFADPGVLNFKAYEQTEVVPGGVFPATAKTGKSVSDGFYEVKTTTLSQEVMPFSQFVQQLGQLVSGATPSIFGGQLEGSNTASEYSMSRSQALQRLQNTWKTFTLWWKIIFGKVIPMAIKEIKTDEREVQLNDDGDFINILIKKAELEGKIGRVELEANENLPMTWNQRKDVWMQLLQSPSPEIMQILSAPENIPIMREAIGLDDITVPGDDDRIKQYDEIKILLNSEPIQPPPMTDEMGMPMADPMSGQMMPPPEPQPSVEIDPIFDNHAIEFEICRKWIVSEAGRIAKIENPQGYMNVLLHGKQHYMQIQMAQAQAQMMQQNAPPEKKGAANPEKPNKQSGAPIKDESNVPAIH